MGPILLPSRFGDAPTIRRRKIDELKPNNFGWAFYCRVGKVEIDPQGLEVSRETTPDSKCMGEPWGTWCAHGILDLSLINPDTPLRQPNPIK